MKTALIIGATGVTGKELVKLLQDSSAYTKIYLVHYRKTGIEHPKCEEVIIDFNFLHQLHITEKVDEVYCCIGTTIKKAKSLKRFQQIDRDYPLALGKWAKAKGVKSYALVSSVGANAWSKNDYLRTKGEVEEGLKEMAFERLVVLEPSMLYGVPRNEFRIGESVGIIGMKIFSFLMLGPFKKYRLTHINAVAKALFDWNQKDKKGFFKLNRTEF